MVATNQLDPLALVAPLGDGHTGLAAHRLAEVLSKNAVYCG